MNQISTRPAFGAARSLESPRGRAPFRILVAEDDAYLREINLSVLSQQGYAVDAVADGVGAWEAMQVDGYDLLITDNDMPRLTGVELLKKLRASRMELPVIMATGTAPTGDLLLRPWLQPAAMLFKPYSTERLLETVETVLRTSDRALAPSPPPRSTPADGFSP